MTYLGLDSYIHLERARKAHHIRNTICLAIVSRLLVTDDPAQVSCPVCINLLAEETQAALAPTLAQRIEKALGYPSGRRLR